MDNETILNLARRHPQSALIRKWNNMSEASAADSAAGYDRTRKKTITFLKWSVLSFITAAVIVLVVSFIDPSFAWMVTAIIGFTILAVIGMNLRTQAIGMRIIRDMHWAVFGKFAEHVFLLDEALRATKYMSVGHLFVVDEENMLAFINEALVDAAGKVIDAEGRKDGYRRASAKIDMKNLVVALKPFLGDIDVRSYYDRAQNLHRARKN